MMVYVTQGFERVKSYTIITRCHLASWSRHDTISYEDEIQSL